jgi:hypothetical protein
LKRLLRSFRRMSGMAKNYTDTVVSEYGNGKGAMVLRRYADGTVKTVHTGSLKPKAKTSYLGRGRTNVGDPIDNRKRGR